MRKDVVRFVGQIVAEMKNPGGDILSMRTDMKRILDQMQVLAADGSLDFQSPAFSAQLFPAERGLAISLKDRTFEFVTWNIYVQIISSDLVQAERQIRFLVRAIEATSPPKRVIPPSLWNEERWQSLRDDVNLLLARAAQN